MKAQIVAAALAGGFAKDRFGHYLKTNTTRGGEVYQVRLKMQVTSVRFECCEEWVDSTGQKHRDWRNIASDYYKNLALQPDGSVKIGKYRIGMADTR